MCKLKSSRGIATLVVILVIIAAVLIGFIVVPKVVKFTNARYDEIDNGYITAAEREARVIFMQDGDAFTKVFNTETKKFVERSYARAYVNPYGTSKAHKGMVLLVTVDKDGDITTEWVIP